MRGYWNHDRLAKAEFLGESKTNPIFTMIDYGSFPACLTEGETAITGEVYDVTDAELAATDRLEGYPSFYTRVRCITDFGEAWIYVMKPSTLGNSKPTVIPEGIWKPKSKRLFQDRSYK